MTESRPGTNAVPPIHIRHAGPDDADAVADVYLSAFHATYDFPLAHTDAQVRVWLRGVLADGTAWVAEVPVRRADVPIRPAGEGQARPAGEGGAKRAGKDAGEIVGFMRLVGPELDQLYVAPGWWGRGIGSRLVEAAKERSPDGLALWTFQVNGRARRFYERLGFVAVTLTDGAGNEERQPDVRYAWRPDSTAVHTWDAVYAGTPPWDIGRPQSAFRRLGEAGALMGRVLDVGCGTGEHALMAAAMGFDATGVDVAAPALAIARRKAADRGLSARFIEWDATKLAMLGQRWQTVLDCGVFHVFDDAARASYVASLASAVEPGGRYHMLVFSDRQGGTLGPRRISQAEIRSSFADGWSVLSIEAAILETNVGFDPGPTADGGPDSAARAQAGAGGGLHGAQAWLAVIERR